MNRKMRSTLRNTIYRSQKPRKRFFDRKRIIISDNKHSTKEKRFFCLGRVGKGTATVRFTIREVIRSE